MDNKQIKGFISEMTDDSKVPCLHCPLNVFRSDMPRVGVCKICYAKAIRSKTLSQFKNYQTWEELLKNSTTC